MSNESEYELLYWPGIQGRGEFIRLAFAASNTKFKDSCQPHGFDGPGDYKPAAEVVNANFKDENNPPPFAVPVLKHGKILLSQTPNILYYLGPKLNLAPNKEDEIGRLHVNQIFCTIIDLLNEIHDTHHPIASSKYYEEQIEPAKQRSTCFCKERIPKFFNYFERVIEQNKASDVWLYSDKMTYADLSLFYVVLGLSYAFPNATKEQLDKCTAVQNLFKEVEKHPNLGEYRGSGKRTDFSSNQGIFRYYPELQLTNES
jgi:glutathione S-transferase